MLVASSSLYCPSVSLVQSKLRECEYATSSDDSSYSSELSPEDQSSPVYSPDFDIDNIDLEDLTVEIPRERFFIRGSSDPRLFYNKEGFFVQRGEETVRIPSRDIDTLFRNRKVESVCKYAFMHKFKLIELGNGDILVKPQIGLNGGGPGGATAGFYVGKFTVHLIAQGGIMAVSGVVSLIGTPAAGAATFVALEKTVGPAVEVASNVVGLGTGVLGGGASGPA